MQYILHITEKCNFSCGYCELSQKDIFMDKNIALKVADVALAEAIKSNRKSACISFYGGEPLLYKELIFETVEYCKKISKDTDVRFMFMITTNGWFADDYFLRYAKENRINLAFSIDGIQEAHDMHRRTFSNEPTFEHVYQICKNAMQILSDISAMLTFNPDTIKFLSESVKFLFESGFKTIITTPNLCVEWSEGDLDILREQYEKLSGWYGDLLLSEEEIKLPIFDNKIVNWLTPQIMSDKCVPGKNRVSIDVNGNIYPCIEYSYFKEYKMGSVDKDIFVIDEIKVKLMVDEINQINECEKCALKSRCDNKCGCRNLISTGNINKVSPLWCAHERILIPIADKLGERIFVN